jgi:hypothetical protein
VRCARESKNEYAPFFCKTAHSCPFASAPYIPYYFFNFPCIKAFLFGHDILGAWVSHLSFQGKADFRPDFSALLFVCFQGRVISDDPAFLYFNATGGWARKNRKSPGKPRWHKSSARFKSLYA